MLQSPCPTLHVGVVELPTPGAHLEPQRAPEEEEEPVRKLTLVATKAPSQVTRLTKGVWWQQDRPKLMEVWWQTARSFKQAMMRCTSGLPEERATKRRTQMGRAEGRQ